jgi:hypothetical protein
LKGGGGGGKEADERARLIQKEQVEMGRVSLGIYWRYVRAAGCYLSLALPIFMVGGNLLFILTTRNVVENLL